MKFFEMNPDIDMDNYKSKKEEDFSYQNMVMNKETPNDSKQ